MAKNFCIGLSLIGVVLLQACGGKHVPSAVSLSMPSAGDYKRYGETGENKFRQRKDFEDSMHEEKQRQAAQFSGSQEVPQDPVKYARYTFEQVYPRK